MKVVLILAICVVAVLGQGRTREQLLAEARRLTTEAQAELRRLETAGTPGLGVEVRRLETELITVERQLQNETNPTRVTTLESTLSTLETRLAADLRRLRGGAF